MPDDRHHLSPELHAATAAGDAPGREELVRLIEHAAAACARCREVLVSYREVLDGRAHTPRGSAGREGNHRAAALGLVGLARAFRADRRAATREIWELGRAEPEALPRKVERAFRRFHSPLLAERMIERGRERLRRDPREAALWFEAAEMVALRAVTTAGDHDGPARELLWRARAQRANALRVAGELPEGAALFETLEAQVAADRELPSLAFRAELASLIASLRQDQRRFGEAENRLREAGLCYQRIGDQAGELRTKIQRGIGALRRGTFHEATDLLKSAHESLTSSTPPSLATALHYNLGLALCESGDPAGARSLVESNRSLFDPSEGAIDGDLLTWIEGKIAAGLGETENALTLLGRARTGYLERGLGCDAAMVNLDLAELHLHRGNTAEVKTLAEEMFAVFEARDVHAEAARALRLFQRAATAERLTVELVAALRRYLATSRNDPGHRFRAAGHAALS